MPTLYRENRANEDYIHHFHFTRLSSYTIWKQNYTSRKLLEDDARDRKEGEGEEEEEEEGDYGEEQEGISCSNEGRFAIGQRSVCEDEKKCYEMKAGVLSKHLMKLPRDASVVPYLEQWFAEKNGFPKNVIVVALTNLKRDRRYKQALEVRGEKCIDPLRFCRCNEIIDIAGNNTRLQYEGMMIFIDVK